MPAFCKACPGPGTRGKGATWDSYPYGAYCLVRGTRHFIRTSTTKWSHWGQCNENKVTASSLRLRVLNWATRRCAQVVLLSKGQVHERVRGWVRGHLHLEWDLGETGRGTHRSALFILCHGCAKSPGGKDSSRTPAFRPAAQYCCCDERLALAAQQEEPPHSKEGWFRARPREAGPAGGRSTARGAST